MNRSRKEKQYWEMDQKAHSPPPDSPVHGVQHCMYSVDFGVYSWSIPTLRAKSCCQLAWVLALLIMEIKTKYAFIGKNFRERREGKDPSLSSWKGLTLMQGFSLAHLEKHRASFMGY